MEKVITRIVDKIKQDGSISSEQVDRLLRERCAETHDAVRSVSKRACMSFYSKARDARTPFWLSLDIDAACDQAIVKALRSKPRRTASGVATITVLTKPYPCSSDCIYCPNDIRMPKSYLSDEPACQRAERNFFDPYLQVMARLRVLHDLGHITDKVEMIILGGTFSEYPREYQIWFVSEVFRALNEFGTPDAEINIETRRSSYIDSGALSEPEENALRVLQIQQKIDSHELTYNEAYRLAYSSKQSSCDMEQSKMATMDELFKLQEENSKSEHRMVGLVVETRPDLVSFDHLVHLRSLGCTKVQIGIQSLDDAVLSANARYANVESISSAFAALRLFGFKSHVHYMVNLLDSTPEGDAQGYEKLMSDPAFKPDEVKLYPCALVQSSKLMCEYNSGRWSPYTRSELIDILSECVAITPAYTRISRMIRDISSKDIVVGNKSTNLRQMVEARLQSDSVSVSEIRMREVAKRDIAPDSLKLEVIEYVTSNTKEYFLQWVDEEGTLAAFLRLSLPKRDAVACLCEEHPDSPIVLGQAMIREVHVYGRVSKLHEANEGTQHLGLGRALIERAIKIAQDANFTSCAVISAVGTRAYYEGLGFEQRGLYHVKDI